MLVNYITPTLLNAFTNSYDWVSMIKREPIEKTQAMINGEIFEKEVYNGNIEEASEQVKNAIYQPCLYGNFDKFYLFGYADFLLPTKIIDTKFKSHYEVGTFYNSNQHLIYTALADMDNFTYLIGVGTDPKKPKDMFCEDYKRDDELLLSRLYDFDRAIDMAGLREIYNTNYSINRIIDKIEKIWLRESEVEMTNLLKETKSVLKEHNKTLDDVIAIFGNDFQITKENFIKVANEEYDSDFGAQKVAQDLQILGKDFVMTRGEYDGSEWWEYIPFNIEVPQEIVEVKRVITNEIGWDTLKDINEEESEV